MGVRHWPTGDVLFGTHWAAVNATTAFVALNTHGFVLGRDTPKTYLVHDGTPGFGFDDAHRVICSFAALLPASTIFPPTPVPSYSSVPYTVGNDGVTLRICLRTLYTAVDPTLTYTAYRAGVKADAGTTVIPTGAFLPGVNPSPWTVYSYQMLVDPLTTAAWTVDNLAATSFGFYLPFGGGGNTMQVSGFNVEVDERIYSGNIRARMGPGLEEPALTCAICSVPKHIRDLIRVSEPRHPMAGRWVCTADYDTIDPEKFGGNLFEGDIYGDIL